jgi:N-acetylmuramoyl-L-alanine amidase
VDKIRILIDPGHGGHDSGAVVSTGAGFLAEKDINLNVALILEAIFRTHGDRYDVGLSRKADVYVPLQTRTWIANREKAYLLSIHCNAVTDPQAHGTEVWSFAKYAHLNKQPTIEPGKQEYIVLSQGYMWARTVGQEIAKETGLKWRPRKYIYDREKGEYIDRKLYILRKTTKPAILVECGFLTNPDESEGLDIDLDGFNENIAVAIFNATDAHFYPKEKEVGSEKEVKPNADEEKGTEETPGN